MDIRPYIVLNDVCSKQIVGLLIQSLPPISKPKMRTQNEQIDGRDGDIVTPLGFAAYNKAVKIGLTYNYNVDDIIDFFNSSGKVVFSNEPDKYYNYAIYDQINFDKLIRFREASVNFHVQPFKFSDTEGVKVYTFNNAANGSLLIRNNGNYYSRPVITIKGSGTINLMLNGQQLLIINMAGLSQIIIDSEQMNAYTPAGILANRLVIGDYDKIQLKAGQNTIAFNGSVTEIDIKNYSRWI